MQGMHVASECACVDSVAPEGLLNAAAWRRHIIQNSPSLNPADFVTELEYILGFTVVFGVFVKPKARQRAAPVCAQACVWCRDGMLKGASNSFLCACVCVCRCVCANHA